jgi:hypothetical protein
MSPKDYAIWQRYRQTFLPPARALYFDIALGKGDRPETPALPPVDSMWRRVTSFRADLIIDTPDGWTLVELRDNAGAGALGALILYGDLWTEDPPDSRPLTLQLVTNTTHPDLSRTCQKHGITVTVV